MDGRGRHGHHRRGPKVDHVPIACEVCGKVREYLASEIRVRGRIRFCSTFCRDAARPRTNMATIPCAFCGREFAKRRDQIARVSRPCCSKTCSSASRRVVGAKWKDPKAIKTYMRAYIEANRDRHNAKSVAWSKANRPKKTAASQRWRARLKTAMVGVVDFEVIKARDRMRCHICKRKVRESEIHFDHVIPLARGGEHSQQNIAVTHGRCNVRKGASVRSLF